VPGARAIIVAKHPLTPSGQRGRRRGDVHGTMAAVHAAAGCRTLPAAPAAAPRDIGTPNSIILACRAEEVRAKFEKYGPIRDVYLPKDYCECAAQLAAPSPWLPHHAAAPGGTGGQEPSPALCCAHYSCGSARVKHAPLHKQPQAPNLVAPQMALPAEVAAWCRGLRCPSCFANQSASTRVRA
jgi:hypothetical protein